MIYHISQNHIHTLLSLHQTISELPTIYIPTLMRSISSRYRITTTTGSRPARSIPARICIAIPLYSSFLQALPILPDRSGFSLLTRSFPPTLCTDGGCLIAKLLCMWGKAQPHKASIPMRFPCSMFQLLTTPPLQKPHPCRPGSSCADRGYYHQACHIWPFVAMNSKTASQTVPFPPYLPS